MYLLHVLDEGRVFRREKRVHYTRPVGNVTHVCVSFSATSCEGAFLSCFCFMTMKMCILYMWHIYSSAGIFSMKCWIIERVCSKAFWPLKGFTGTLFILALLAFINTRSTTALRNAWLYLMLVSSRITMTLIERLLLLLVSYNGFKLLYSLWHILLLIVLLQVHYCTFWVSCCLIVLALFEFHVV